MISGDNTGRRIFGPLTVWEIERYRSKANDVEVVVNGAFASFPEKRVDIERLLDEIDDFHDSLDNKTFDGGPDVCDAILDEFKNSLDALIYPHQVLYAPGALAGLKRYVCGKPTEAEVATFISLTKDLADCMKGLRNVYICGGKYGDVTGDLNLLYERLTIAEHACPSPSGCRRMIKQLTKDVRELHKNAPKHAAMLEERMRKYEEAENKFKTEPATAENIQEYIEKATKLTKRARQRMRSFPDRKIELEEIVVKIGAFVEDMHRESFSKTCYDCVDLLHEWYRAIEPY